MIPLRWEGSNHGGSTFSTQLLESVARRKSHAGTGMRENNKVSVIHIADKTLDDFRRGKNTNFDACVYSETLDTTLIQLRAAEDLIDAR
jgi:hypothetical protein